MQYFLDLLTMVINVILCVYFIYGKCPVRTGKAVQRIGLISAAVAAKSLLMLFHISPLNFISGCALIVLAIGLLFQCSKSFLLTYSALFAMITLSADAFGVIIVSIFHQKTIDITLGTTALIWQHHLWNWLLQIIMTRIAKLLIQKKKSFQIHWHEITFYILLVLFEIGIFAYFSYSSQTNTSGFVMLIIMFGFLLLDLYLIYIFNRMSLMREKERQADLMTQQEQLQLHMYRELQKMYQTTCSAAHDIQRHVNALKTLVKEKSNGDNYLADLSETAKKLQPRIKNQNEILEIILNTAASRCEKENIQLDMDIEDFSMSFMSDMDITTIFSNLLDNAIDACMELEDERRIEIVLCQKMGLTALRIANSCVSSNNAVLKKWHSTKKNHTGIGLNNVEKAVEKYEGVVSVKTAPKIFQVSVTLPDK